MKKDITMHKTNFVKGAFITTLGIIISKVLGIIYVIPFHAMIGEKGGALYGYAYTVYTVVIAISAAGIPLGISKIVSEYQTLGYYQAKKRVFYLGKKIAFIFSFCCFILLFIFAPLLAKVILGEVVGGNSLEDIAFVIRIIGLSILVVPVLSVYRGYFEGHRYLRPSSISQVIEQVVRVSFILLGSFIVFYVFHLSLSSTVGIALLGTFIGAGFSCFYLFYKKRKNSFKFNEKIRHVNEPIISDRVILKKIFMYAIPFIMIDVYKSLYNTIDMIMVVKSLVNYAKYMASDAEAIYAILSTWGTKFNMVILAISSGIVVSLIPSLTESVVKKDSDEVQKKIQQTFSVLLLFAIPLTMGISFLAKAIWILFYGNSVYGPNILCYYIFVGFFMAFFTVVVTILMILKDYKDILISLIAGLLCKIIFNVQLMKTFYQMGLPPYYGFITASIIGYFISTLVCIHFLRKKYNIQFEDIIRDFIDVMIASFLMIFCLFLLKFLVPVYLSSRVLNMFIILLYGVVGIIIYFLYGNRSGLIKRVLGKDYFKFLKELLFINV